MKRLFHGTQPQEGRTVYSTLKLFNQLGGLFQEACVNFVLLMRINYPKFICSCDGSDGVVVDCTKVCLASVQCKLLNEWRETPTWSKEERKARIKSPECDELYFLPLDSIQSKHTEQRSSLARFKKLVFDFTGRTTFDKRKKKTHTSGMGLTVAEYVEMQRLNDDISEDSETGDVLRTRLRSIAPLLSEFTTKR